MSDHGETPLISEAIQQAALAWHIRVQSDQANEDDWTALSDWLEESPMHLQAYERVESLLVEIDENREPVREALDPPAGEVVRLRPRGRRGFARPLWGVLAAAGVVAVAVLGPVAWRSYQGPLSTYRTGAGQIRTVHLADGSTVHLDVASSMSVRLGWHARQVTLADAEASFDVAKDARRPFVIKVGDQVVKVVGTEFNIRHYDGNTVITVRRGIVQVFQPSLSTMPIARLTKGGSLTHRDGTPSSTLAQVDPDPSFGWAQGQLVCNDQPLSEIVAYLNRRYPTPIQLSSAAAQRRFTGVLTLGKQTDVVRHLSQYLSLSVDTTKPTITLR